VALHRGPGGKRSEPSIEKPLGTEEPRQRTAAGLDAEAEKARIEFSRQRPDMTENWRAAWADRLARSEDRAHLEEGARKAGFKVSE
jgi:hypothetical protein